MNDFFISYHQETGNKYALHLYKRLSEDFKRIVFFDTKDKGLSIEINNKLEQAILDSRIFIAIITEGYGDSRWCMVASQAVGPVLLTFLCRTNVTPLRGYEARRRKTS